MQVKKPTKSWADFEKLVTKSTWKSPKEQLEDSGILIVPEIGINVNFLHNGKDLKKDGGYQQVGALLNRRASNLTEVRPVFDGFFDMFRVTKCSDTGDLAECAVLFKCVWLQVYGKNHDPNQGNLAASFDSWGGGKYNVSRGTKKEIEAFLGGKWAFYQMTVDRFESLLKYYATVPPLALYTQSVIQPLINPNKVKLVDFSEETNKNVRTISSDELHPQENYENIRIIINKMPEFFEAFAGAQISRLHQLFAKSYIYKVISTFTSTSMDSIIAFKTIQKDVLGLRPKESSLPLEYALTKVFEQFRQDGEMAIHANEVLGLKFKELKKGVDLGSYNGISYTIPNLVYWARLRNEWDHTRLIILDASTWNPRWDAEPLLKKEDF